MASSSFYHQSKKIKSFASTTIFDVFINHRGPDVKETLALPLYNYLQELGIRAFLDREEIKLGDSFPYTIETALRLASVHIAIFSKRYAESAWCLAELVLMLQTKAKIIPVFYDVEPSDLRYIEKGAYADAFSEFKNKGRHLDKLEEWKEALQNVSLMTTPDDFNKLKHNRYALCRILAHAVLKEMEKKNPLDIAKKPLELDEIVGNEKKHRLDGAKYPVGLEELVEDFERHCGQVKSNVIGIFGMGGCGKTTLAKQFFNLKRSDYDGSCFLFDVAETGLASLQIQLVKDLFRGDFRDMTHFKDIPKVQGTGEGTRDHIADSKIIKNDQRTEEGTSNLRNHLKRGRFLRFLIVIDDIDHIEQLDALLHRDILNSGSLAIVTTRDESVLTKAEIVLRYSIKKMNLHHSRQLFCWHAFHRSDPSSGYEDLVRRFLIACGGLPLCLEVLGGHVFGRDKSFWELELDKVYRILPRDIKHMLKISFDALDFEKKQIFMDITCFFIGQPKAMAISIWEESGWTAEKALQTLKDKSLVEVVIEEMDECKELEFDDRLVFRMHGHLRQLGREMADKLSSPCRWWRTEDLKSSKFTGFQKILIETNGLSLRCFNTIFDWSVRITYFLGNSDGNAKTVLLWLELDLQDMLLTSIPPWIPLQNLQCLKISNGGLKSLWQSDVQAPFQLKRLVLYGISSLKDLKPIEMLHDLEDLVLSGDLFVTATMVMEGRSLSESLKKLTYLKRLVLRHFILSGELELSNGRKLKSTSREPAMSSLEKIEITTVELVSKVSVWGDHCPSLKSLKIAGMEDLIEIDLTRVTTLKCLKLEYCTELQNVSGISDLENLEMLYLLDCPKLEKLPSLVHMSRLQRISVDKCGKLQNLEGIEKLEALKYLHVAKINGPVGRRAIWNTIYGLQRLPSVISVFGRAANGAKSDLSANLFSGVIEPAAMSKIPTPSFKTPQSFSAIIVCAVVVCSPESVLIEVPTPPNNSLTSGLPIPDRDRQWSRLPAGEWTVTIAVAGDYARHYIAQSSWITSKGHKDPIIKEGYILPLNKGEESKIAILFKTIISKLYYEFKEESSLF